MTIFSVLAIYLLSALFSLSLLTYKKKDGNFYFHLDYYQSEQKSKAAALSLGGPLTLIILLIYVLKDGLHLLYEKIDTSDS